MKEIITNNTSSPENGNDKEWFKKNHELISALINKELDAIDKIGKDEYYKEKKILPPSSKFREYIIDKACKELNCSSKSDKLYKLFEHDVFQLFGVEIGKRKKEKDLSSLGVEPEKKAKNIEKKYSQRCRHMD